jgi:hypothetical protein
METRAHRTCGIDGCGRREVKKSGLCLDHFRKATHLGEIGPRIPCATSGCRFFQVRKDLCTNCHARGIRKLPHVKEYEREFRRKYMSRPEIRALVRERRRKWDERTGYYQSERYRASKRAYYTSDHGRRKYARNTAKRRAKKLNATPTWLNAEHAAHIKRIYDNCPPGYHVDHIVPLINDQVCGLHVPWNLQYLRADENIRKGNRLNYEVDPEAVIPA